MTKIRSIVLEYDLIEIHHNPVLKNKPYLVRVFSYDYYSNPKELRLDQQEVDNLYQVLKENNIL